MSVVRKGAVAQEAREKAVKAAQKAEADGLKAEARKAASVGGVPPPPPPPPPGMGGPPPPPPMMPGAAKRTPGPGGGLPLMSITEDDDGATEGVKMRRPKTKAGRGPPPPTFNTAQLLSARLKKTETNRKSLSVRSIDLTKNPPPEK
jgi:hypothetical protein